MGDAWNAFGIRVAALTLEEKWTPPRTFWSPLAAADVDTFVKQR